ncbi:hypothetical protein ACC687_37845, partial [Rhizobium ruizarguesonis]
MNELLFLSSELLREGAWPIPFADSPSLRKTIAIDQRTYAILASKLKPQVFSTSNSGRPCDVIGC